MAYATLYNNITEVQRGKYFYINISRDYDVWVELVRLKKIAAILYSRKCYKLEIEL